MPGSTNNDWTSFLKGETSQYNFSYKNTYTTPPLNQEPVLPNNPPQMTNKIITNITTINKNKMPFPVHKAGKGKTHHRITRSKKTRRTRSKKTRQRRNK